mmetsp:Transcript_13612/g.37624  ORF Transcript_13612/g.37624 Transcript_13612/m.37624 type:complete len:84 (+) Transcript_13612:277-528(+)
MHSVSAKDFITEKEMNAAVLFEVRGAKYENHMNSLVLQLLQRWLTGYVHERCSNWVSVLLRQRLTGMCMEVVQAPGPVLTPNK